MHAISSYRGNRPTHSPTNKQTGPITIHCAVASAQCNNRNVSELLLTFKKNPTDLTYYTVFQKNPCDYVFDDNLNSKRPILLIFGTVIT